ncbi:hypothetical protein P3T43_003760 [Paraburkholderia sp. GAS41]|jgi:hypothetical protein
MTRANDLPAIAQTGIVAFCYAFYRARFQKSTTLLC